MDHPKVLVFEPDKEEAWSANAKLTPEERAWLEQQASRN